jgi:hypothetical protein
MLFGRKILDFGEILIRAGTGIKLIGEYSE